MPCPRGAIGGEPEWLYTSLLRFRATSGSDNRLLLWITGFRRSGKVWRCPACSGWTGRADSVERLGKARSYARERLNDARSPACWGGLVTLPIRAPDRISRGDTAPGH